MSTMIMNMSQGNIERDEPETAEYGDEILCSGWNPVVAMAQLIPENQHRSIPVELANVDVELFLKKMYG